MVVLRIEEVQEAPKKSKEYSGIEEQPKQQENVSGTFKQGKATKGKDSLVVIYFLSDIQDVHMYLCRRSQSMR